MKLLTQVETSKSAIQITAHSGVLVVGSCFAQSLAERLVLSDSMVDRLVVNPSGVVYNPLSVARAVEILIGGEQFSQADLVQSDGLWHSMDFHGSFSAVLPSDVLGRINRPPHSGFDLVVVTLGTAFVYFRDSKVVANCHKLPQREFDRRLITVDQTVEALNRVAAACTGADIIVTVSPIRHLGDGLSRNCVSKATLRLAADQFCQADKSHRSYFAAFEILTDELRDYRFTDQDMCHPTAQAKEYIWQRFAHTFVDQELLTQIELGRRRAISEAHRPLR